MSKVTLQQVVAVMLGNELSSKEIVQQVRARHQQSNPDPDDIKVMIKTILKSPLCYISIGSQNRRRTYLLHRVDAEIYHCATQSCVEERRSLSGGPGWNATEKQYIQFVRDFDRLLRDVR